MTKYEIKTVADFFKLPPEKVNQCLDEFKSFIAFYHLTKAIEREVGETINCDPVFNWIDDGKTDITAQLNNIETGDFIQTIKVN